MADALQYCRRCSSVLAADGGCPTCNPPRRSGWTPATLVLLLFFVLTTVGVGLYFFFGPL